MEAYYIRPETMSALLIMRYNPYSQYSLYAILQSCEHIRASGKTFKNPLNYCR